MESGLYDTESPDGDDLGDDRTIRNNNRQGGNIRGRAFSIKEDELLCRSWLASSEEADPGQKSGTFWNRVCEHFNKNKDWENERSESSLIHRFSTINLSISKFSTCFAQVESVNEETEDVYKMDEAKLQYLDIQKRIFSLEHCWYILHGANKYEEYLRRPAFKRPTSTPDTLNSEMDDYGDGGEPEKIPTELMGYDVADEEVGDYEDLQQNNMSGYEEVEDCEDLQQANLTYEETGDYEDLQQENVNNLGDIVYEDARDYGEDLEHNHKRSYEDVGDDEDVQQPNKRYRENASGYGDPGLQLTEYNEVLAEVGDRKQNTINEINQGYGSIRDNVYVKPPEARIKIRRQRGNPIADKMRKFIEQNQAILEMVRRKEEDAIRRDAGRYEREQKKEDDMIMLVDTSDMDEVQKTYYEYRQAEVAARLNLIPDP